MFGGYTETEPRAKHVGSEQKPQPDEWRLRQRPKCAQNAVHRPTSLEMFSIVILSSTRLREKASFFLHEPVGWFLRAPCEKNSLEYFHDSKVAPDLPQRVCDLPQPGVAAKLHPSDNKRITGQGLRNGNPNFICERASCQLQLMTCTNSRVLMRRQEQLTKPDGPSTTFAWKNLSRRPPAAARGYLEIRHSDSAVLVGYSRVSGPSATNSET